MPCASPSRVSGIPTLGRCTASAAAQVTEIRVDHATDTYRTVYTVSLGDVVYVLHAFQKKSTRGIKTPKRHLDTIAQRLEQAQELHRQREQQQREHDDEQ